MSNRPSALPAWQSGVPSLRPVAAAMTDVADRINSITPAGDGGTTFGGVGTVQNPPPPPPRLATVVVEITQGETCGGKYGGHSFGPDTQAAAAANLAMPEGMIDNGSVDCLIVNLGENGLGEVHTLPMNSFHSGLLIGYVSPNDATYATLGQRMIVAIYAVGSPIFAVTVTQTGGYNGTSGSPASWTYTVKTADGTVTLAVNIEPTKPRPNGSMAPGNAFGLAFCQANGNLQLWDAGEVPNGTLYAASTSGGSPTVAFAP